MRQTSPLSAFARRGALGVLGLAAATMAPLAHAKTSREPPGAPGRPLLVEPAAGPASPAEGGDRVDAGQSVRLMPADERYLRSLIERNGIRPATSPHPDDGKPEPPARASR